MYLRQALSQLAAFQELYAFSKSEHNNENIEFLQLCQWLNPGLGRPAINLFPSHCHSVLPQTTYIYKHYIAKTLLVNKKEIENPSQVNLPGPMMKELEEAKILGLMDKHTFDEAYDSILGLVDFDLWGRFVASEGGRKIGAEITPPSSARVANAAAAPVNPPPIVFNAPAIVITPAAVPLPPAPVQNVVQRPVVSNNAVAAAANNVARVNAAPPQVSAFRHVPNQAAPLVANRAIPRPPLPPLPALPPRAAADAANFRHAHANLGPLPALPAANAAPLLPPPPPPPVLIAPAEVVVTRPRAGGIRANNPLVLVRRPGPRHLDIE